MAKLIFSLDGAFLGEYPIDRERITIGRRSANDIHIDNLAVSGEHASVLTIGGDSFLEDLDSSNGTIVNGKPIKKHVLQHADLIEIGRYQFKYISESRFSPSATKSIEPSAETPPTANMQDSKLADTDDKSEQSINVKSPSTATISSPVAVASMSETASQEPAPGRLQVLNGPNAGKELVLNKALTTLGKPGVQVAVITKRSQGYFITHVEGQNHPIINEKTVGAQAHQLGEHDVIELAGIKMVFFLAKS